MEIAADSPMADLMQISTKWPGANKDKQSTTTTETHRIQYYTSQTRKSDKRPCGRFGVNFCKCTASEKLPIVNEILNKNLMEIAADSPMADLMQISTKWPVANKDKQSTTTTETHRVQYYTSQMRKSDKRPCGRFDVNFCKSMASVKWSIVNEIPNENFMTIASDSPMPDLMRISAKWLVANRNNPRQRLKLTDFNTIRRKCANRALWQI